MSTTTTTITMKETMEETKKKTTYYLLTGDVGGTNSRMGLYSVNGDDKDQPLVVKYYRNQDYLTSNQKGLFETNIIAPFLKYCWEEQTEKTLTPLEDEDVEIIACLAIAGPVKNNQVSMSNLHFLTIDGAAIASHTHDKYLSHVKVCQIINDFVAQGYGCLTLQSNEVMGLTKTSNLKTLDPTGPKVCVGAGTGLGECFLTPDTNNNYTCFPSEGGHVEWAPRNDIQWQLWRSLKQKFGYDHRLSVERVVSGIGLANVYEFLSQTYPDQVDPAIHQEFLQAGDEQGKVVAMNCPKNIKNNPKGGSMLCEQAMEIMMSAYGCEVGSAAIKFIPTGGLFVTGGLTPKNLPYIQPQDSAFLKAYFDKGRVAPLLDHVPLFAVLVEDLGVRGARKRAQLEYEMYVNGGVPMNAKNSNSSNNKKDLALYMGVAAMVGAVLGMALSSKKNK